MVKQVFSFFGTLLLAGAALIGTAGTGLAGHGGGGGGHGGGGHGGHGGHGGASWGGHHGGGGGGYHHRYFYGYGGYSPYYYDSYSSGYDRPYRYSYYPSSDVIADDTTAHVTVTVPADAELWFNGTRMKTMGPSRRFETPSLSSGRFTYEARAQWTENGRVVTQTQEFSVSQGAQVKVTFPLASGSE
jgi:uncharacterized protein (TIGR03000 family)